MLAFELYDAILDGYYDQSNDGKNQALNKAKEIITNDPTVLSTKVCISKFINDKKTRNNKMNKMHPLAIFRFDSSLPLSWVSHLGNEEMVELFLQMYPEASSQTADYNRIPLHEATRGGHIKIMKDLLHVYPEGAEVQDRLGRIPLHYAAGSGYIHATILLLQSFPDGVKYQDRLGDSPLHFAMSQGHVKCATELLNLYPEAPYVKNHHGNLPLYDSVRNCHLETTFILLHKTKFKGGLFDEREETDEKALPLWQRRNTIWNKLERNFGEERVKHMLDGAEHYPILHDAIGSISVDGIRFIIDHFSIDLRIKDEFGRDALLVAIIKASKVANHWDDYYRPIIEMMITNICDKRDEEKCTSCTLISHSKTDIDRHFLHISAELKLPWNGGVERILKSNISALSMYDSKTGLLPFMLAAEGTDGSVMTAFELLKNQPDVIKHTK